MVILLICIAGHAYYKLDRKDQSHQWFLILNVLTTVILILEILSVILNSVDNIHLIIWHKLVDTLGFTLSSGVPISAVLYVYHRTNQSKKTNQNLFFWLSVPLIVNSIVSLGSFHFNWIFKITDANRYVRGPLFFISPMTSFFYYIVTMIFLYGSQKKVNREERFALSLLLTIPAVMSVFQFFYYIYLTIWNSIAVAVIINYILMVYNQTKLDPLTGLGNRLAFHEYLTSVGKKKNIVLAVINIDLDDFKTINDLYGHHEGDHVLKFFARQLEEVFKENGVPIRWGGDEFIVLIKENCEEVLEEYLRTLITKINAGHESGYMPYQINFSYGITIFDPGHHCIDELIQHSDAMMYQAKQKKRQGILK